MTDRSPRWMQLGIKKNNANDISNKSKSSRYTPLKSNHSSEEQSKLRQIAHNISQNSIQLQSDKKLVRSVINFTPSDSGDHRNSSANFKMTESLTNSKGKSSHHHIRNPETKKRHSELDIPALDIVDKDLDIEGQFKQYLQYIENIERKFQNQKLQIQNMLISQHEQIKETKNRIIEKFAEKQSQIKDRSLKKVILNRMSERNRPQFHPQPLLRVVSEQKFQTGSPKVTRQGMTQRKNENSKHSEDQRGHSANSWASNKFDKIFTTLNQMKMNLNDCKKLRQSKSPTTSKPKYAQNKGNLVNTNQLRVKSKKTHE